MRRRLRRQRCTGWNTGGFLEGGSRNWIQQKDRIVGDYLTGKLTSVFSPGCLRVVAAMFQRERQRRGQNKTLSRQRVLSAFLLYTQRFLRKLGCLESARGFVHFRNHFDFFLGA